MTTYNIPKQLSYFTETELKTSREKFGFNQADKANQKIHGTFCYLTF
jgi:hypothetical protein